MKSFNEEEREQQEQWVGQIFCDGYKGVTGIELEGNEVGPQPPDRVFYYKDLKIGCEMFEVEQFHSARGFFNKLENKICEEFKNRGWEQRYQGMRIDFTTTLTETDTAQKIIERWTENKVKGNNFTTCADELSDVVRRQNIDSVDSIPANGLPMKIDPKLYPALSALTTVILISKGTPLVVIGGNYLIPKENEVVCKLINKINKKMKRKQDPDSGWRDVDHSVLIAHELPRKHAYLYPFEWPKHLKTAAEKVELLESFDELWFVRPVTVVTESDIVENQAQFICGSHLKLLN